MSDKVWKDFGVGLILTAVAATAGVIYGANLTQAKAYLQPTCSAPVGLRPIPRSMLEAAGLGTERYEAAAAIDGFDGSEWSPPMVTDVKSPEHRGLSKFVPVFSGDPARSTLTVSLKAAHDVKLLCITNGLGNGDDRYENWGKVRTLNVTTDRDPNTRTATLQSLPVDQSEVAQSAGADLGKITTVRLRVLDAYAGKDVISNDPDRCHWVVPNNRTFRSIHNNQETFEPGCIVGATPKAGISEVTLYESDPNNRPPFPWGLFA